MEVVKVEDRWVCRCTYQEKNIPKAAGFRWDPAARVWFTIKADVALKLATAEQHAQIATELKENLARRSELIESSRAATANVVLPCPDGLAYLPYQRAGIASAIPRPNTLFGDEMGLGKTIQAIGVLNWQVQEHFKKNGAGAHIPFRILVVCPASLRLNWQRELRKWLIARMAIAFASTKQFEPSLANIWIINYDILATWHQKLRSLVWDCIIADEAHLMKNPKAKRTIALLGQRGLPERSGMDAVPEIKPVEARRLLFLTGTPIPNRIEEGFPLFHRLAPEDFRSKSWFQKRYCSGGMNDAGFYDSTGASNLGELQNLLRSTVMIRRLKMDVLTELPAKRRSIIEIPADDMDIFCQQAVAREQEAFAAHEARMVELRSRVELSKASEDPADYAAAVADLKKALSVAFEEMARVRHETAVAKIPFVVDHIREVLDQRDKLVVFAHHHDVIEAIAKEFGHSAVTLYGPVSYENRQAAVDRFQTDESCRLFIGGILAAGVGITLTAASHVVFAELDWVPGNITQAEDRCHRIGQTDMVLVEHLVLEESLDARMAEVLVEKQEVLSAALDKTPEICAQGPAVPSKDRPATDNATPAQLATVAATFTPDQVAAIHSALQELAAMDGDRARSINGVGFSKLDSDIGHSLARCARLTPKQAALGALIVKRYRRQVPEQASWLQ